MVEELNRSAKSTGLKSEFDQFYKQIQLVGKLSPVSKLGPVSELALVGKVGLVSELDQSANSTGWQTQPVRELEESGEID